MFSERHGCYACICDDGFNNETIVNNPHCQQIKCNIEVHYADRLMAGCIPIYYGKVNCCPIGWRCRKWIYFCISANRQVFFSSIFYNLF